MPDRKEQTIIISIVSIVVFFGIIGGLITYSYLTSGPQFEQLIDEGIITEKYLEPNPKWNSSPAIYSFIELNNNTEYCIQNIDYNKIKVGDYVYIYENNRGSRYSGENYKIEFEVI